MDTMNGNNRVDPAYGVGEEALGPPRGRMRERTLSEMGAELGLSEGDVSRLAITDFFVAHPFLVHFLVLCIAVGVTLLNPDKRLIREINLSAIIPDYGFWTDGFHLDFVVRNELKEERTTGNPQRGVDEALQVFFQQVKCDKVADPDCNMEDHPWILTPQNLKKIIEYEQEITNHPKWEDVCYIPLEVAEYSDCSESVSSATGLLVALLGDDFESMTTLQIKGIVKMGLGAMPALSALFSADILEGLESDNPADMKAEHYRSIFTPSLPFPTNITETLVQVGNNSNVTETVIEKGSRYKSFFDDLWMQRQENVIEGYFGKFYKDRDVAGKGRYIDEDGYLRIRSYNFPVWGRQFNETSLEWAITLMCISAIISLVYTTYNLGSLFLPLCALEELVLTLPFTWFLYNYVLNIYEFGPIEMGVVFVLLAVGVYYYPSRAFVDHWLHSGHLIADRNDYSSRLSIAWRSAAKRALKAQSTTFVSFLSSWFGTVLLFKAFGMWAGIAVGVNYLLGITLFPCSIIIWEKHVRRHEQRLSEWLRSIGLGFLAFSVAEQYYQRFKSNEKHLHRTSRNESHGSLSEPLDPKSWRSKSLHNLKKGLVDIGFGLQTIETLQEEYRSFGVWVGVYWMNFLTSIWMKVTVFSTASIWVGVACYGMSQIAPIEENENFAGDDTFLMQSLYAVNDYASSDGMRNDLSIMWGTKGLVEGSRKVWTFDHGKPDWVDINVHTVEQQQWLLDYCQSIRTYVSEKHSDPLITSDDHVTCLMESFKDWILDENPSNASNSSIGFLVHNADSDEEYDDAVQKQYFLSRLFEFYHESDEGISYRNGYRMNIRDIGTEGEPEIALKYFGLHVLSKYDFFSLQSTADQEEENWKEFMANSTKDCMDTLGENHGNLCSPRISSLRMAWSEGYLGYWDSAYSSCLSGTLMVLCLLMLSLNNWRMAILVTFNIIFVMVSVLGIVGFMGWKFGLVECTAVVLVLGFSSDYSVHIAHGYLVAPLQDSRKHRCQFALLQNGHALVSSAIISLLSTSPVLMSSDWLLYHKMGVITVLTVASSFAFSFSVFPLILESVGPQGDDGILFSCKVCRRVKEVTSGSSREQALVNV